jgi:spore maturation protein CgeB
LNFLTDDPWNPVHYAHWFMNALPFYDHVFSPRRANLGDLRRLGCRQVSHLPFAYAPELHFAEPPATDVEKERFATDTIFAGGADPDRIQYITALTRAGLKVALYGGYWTRFSETKAYSRGHADPQTLRKAIGGAKIALCLVRRANRDGHSMRTFEVPAIGACMLVEDTEEHREIFGEEGKAAIYFSNIDQMVEKARWLRGSDEVRMRLAGSLYKVITNGNHTYSDRLASMLFQGI